MNVRILLIRIVVFLAPLPVATPLLRAQAPSSQPSMPQDVDPALWRKMTEVDAKSAAIETIVTDFEQSKFTPLLKRPLVSKGELRATTSRMLWDTKQPQPTQMLITDSAASIYYPADKLEEVYPIAGQLAAMAASPLPRVANLAKYFRFEPDDAKSLDPSADASNRLAVKLTPIDEALREHVAQVRVLIDSARGFMIRCEITDSDGERTVVSFSNVRTNVKLGEEDLSIRAGKDVKIVHPLEGMDPGQFAPGGASDRSRKPQP